MISVKDCIHHKIKSCYASISEVEKFISPKKISLKNLVTSGKLSKYIGFSIYVWIMLFFRPAISGELAGQTDSGRNFIITTSSVKGSSNPDGVWGSMRLTYEIEGQRVARKIYTFSINAPDMVSKSGLGLVTVSEKVGGMNGSYKVTYLDPVDDGLVTIGAIELSMDNGKYIEINRSSPEWIKQARMAEISRIVKSISLNRSELMNAARTQSFDDAMVFFAIPEWMDEIRKRDAAFPDKYSRQLNKKVDSSMANLIRREFMGRGVSLCDSDQFDVFVCNLERKTISVCIDRKNDFEVLQYRAGSARKVELSLEKSFVADATDGARSESFRNGEFRYTVDFDGEKNSHWAGVTVEQNGIFVSRQQCHSEKFEPYMLPDK